MAEQPTVNRQVLGSSPSEGASFDGQGVVTVANYSFVKTWQNIPIGARLIRLFLGVTFIYGGWNKATDPGFLDPKSASYIGAQITSYLDTSPISFLLEPMIENATAFGWSIIISEFAIGFATLTGIALELAALGGFFLSITLWLTATWTVKPYFLGSDTAYAILWLALFLLVRQNTKGRRVIALLPDLRDRREVMRILGIAAASVTTANVAEDASSGNLYYTNARVNAQVESNLRLKANVIDLTTANVVELNNLYYTNARVYSNIIAALPTYTGNVSAGNVIANAFYANGTGVAGGTIFSAGNVNITSGGNIILATGANSSVVTLSSGNTAGIINGFGDLTISTSGNIFLSPISTGRVQASTPIRFANYSNTNALATALQGDTVYNTTANALVVYTSSGWTTVGSGGGGAAAAVGYSLIFGG